VKMLKSDFPTLRSNVDLLALLHRSMPEALSTDIHGALAAPLSEAGGADPALAGHPWLVAYGKSASRRSFAHRTMCAVRSAVNMERFELLQGLRLGVEVLKRHGRLLVTTRHPWESNLVQWFANEHPYCIMAQKECIDLGESATLLQPPETTVWTIQKASHATFRLKNALQAPNPSELEHDYLMWLGGRSKGVTNKGFPAYRFRSGYVATREERVANRRNRVPPEGSRPADRGHKVVLRRINRGK
jgi:hypothetical protein